MRQQSKKVFETINKTSLLTTVIFASNTRGDFKLIYFSKQYSSPNAHATHLKSNKHKERAANPEAFVKPAKVPKEKVEAPSQESTNQPTETSTSTTPASSGPTK